MSWNSEETEFFIEEVKNMPQLWDVKSNLYKFRTLKRSSYQTIADKMKMVFPHHADSFDADALAKKFKSLRTIYYANVKKFKNLKSGSGGGGFAVPWVYFNSMEFLKEAEVSNECETNLTNEKITVEEDNVSIVSTDYDCDMSQFMRDVGLSETPSITIASPNHSMVEHSSSSSTIVQEEVAPSSSQAATPALKKKRPGNTLFPGQSKKKRTAGSAEDELLQLACRTLKTINTPEQSPLPPTCEAFGKYVACKMGEFRHQAGRNRCEQEIVQVIMKHLELDSND